MTSQGYLLSPNTKNPHSLDSWAFYYQNAAGNKDNLKIEINYSMRHHILLLVEKQTEVIFLPSYNIRALSSLELFGSKIKALLERTAARDLYDVYNMLNKNIFSEDQLPLLRKIVLFYWAVGGSKKPTIDFRLDAIDNLKFPQIRSSLLPVLRKGEHFDFEKAKQDVKAFLTTLLVYTEQEKSFIDTFNQNNYQPELLFDDEIIIENIKNHPMAIWKTRTLAQ